MTGSFDWGLLEPAAVAGAAAGDDAVLAAMVEFERALVLAVGGAEPGARAVAVAAALRVEALDRDALVAGARLGGVPVIELVAQLRRQAGDADAALVHDGATSQDVLDSALMLVSRAVLGAAGTRLRAAGRGLATLADREAARPITARTLGQEAAPSSFGVAAAGWLDAVSSALDALERLRYPVQLGGAIGTGEAFARRHGDPAAVDRIRAALAGRLALDDPGRSWHTDRAPVLAVADAAAGVSTAAARIGRDLVLAARDGIAHPRRGGPSSAMPHKRNPVDAVVLVANGLRAPGASATVRAAAVSAEFRPAGEWHAEWQAWRGLLRLAAESAEVLAHAIDELVVVDVADDPVAAPEPAAEEAERCIRRAIQRFESLDRRKP